MFKFLQKGKVKKINAALDIDLQPWQIDYIFSAQPDTQIFLSIRSSAKTLTLMLRQMLDTKAKYLWTLKAPLSDDELKSKDLLEYVPVFKGLNKPSLKGRNYLLRWRQIYRKLISSGLKLAEVVWVR